MYKKIIWPFFLVLAIVLSILFAIGFIWALGITSNNKLATKEETVNLENKKADQLGAIREDDGVYELLILGDSIGVGVGDDQGLGLGERYGTQLNEVEDTQVEVINLAVSGAVSGDLAKLVGSGQIDAQIQGADEMIISIGGNDINKLFESEEITINADYEALAKSYNQQIEEIIRRIQELNPQVRMVFIGIYNPYGDKVGSQKLRLLFNWNYESQMMIESFDNTLLVPTYDLFRFHLETYLAIDQFHPSATGYEAIVDRLIRIK